MLPVGHVVENDDTQVDLIFSEKQSDLETTLPGKTGSQNSLVTRPRPHTFSVCYKMVAHFSALIFPLIIIYSAVPGSSLFSWHPTLMALGFSLLMLEGIVIFSKSSSLFPNMTRPSKASIHYWLMGSGVCCVLAGLGAIYVNKEQAGKPHFTSWHGLLGIITVGYACAQSTGGALAKYHKYVGPYIKIRLADLKLYHATSGLLAYLLVTGTLLLSLQTTWAATNIHWALWYACLSCVCASALVVMTHITSTYLPQSGTQRTKS